MTKSKQIPSNYSHHIQQQEDQLHMVVCHTAELEFAFLVFVVKKYFLYHNKKIKSEYNQITFGLHITSRP